MKNLNPNSIPLTGRHIIEASAGTGKTYNITELYIRLLLKNKLLPGQILVMTFTKDATQEIIGRVEDKLRDVIDQILNSPINITIEGQDTLITHGDENYKHLKRALLEIDEAAIFTIHGFCKKILSEQAFASGMEMDITMEVDTSDILQKVVEDFFRQNINQNRSNYEFLKIYQLHTPERFLAKGGISGIIRSNYQIIVDQPVSLENFNILKKQQLELFRNNQDIVEEFLAKIAKSEPQGQRVSEYHKALEWLKLEDNTQFPQDLTIITNGNKIKAAKIKPVFIGLKELKDLQLEIKQQHAAKFIKQACLEIRRAFNQAKEQKAVLDFDDLITKLCQSVKNSQELVETLQLQYPVALIDEFQDTDAEQYQILDTIYPLKRNDLLLLMIGDPKQAIYGFRGGDIFTYLKAKDSTPQQNQWSMDTNWRSTAQMIKAYNRLFYTSDYQEDGVIGKNIFSQGIDYQVVKASPIADSKIRDFGDDLKPINYFYYQAVAGDSKSDIDKKLSNWTANEIVKLLNLAKVSEHDIAILVENSKQATAIQQALKSKQLSSVYLSQRDNVYKSQEAQEILSLIEGINDLENKTLLKKALATSLLGANTAKLIKFNDQEDISSWDEEIEKARELRTIWYKYGFMALIMQVIHQDFIQRSDSKERTITNILHLAELIKVAENKYKHPNQLIKWYRQQLKNDINSEGELRLESDDALIKIITIHGSKGLEYPIVFIPFATYVSTMKFSADKLNKYYSNQLNKTVYKIGKCDEAKNIIKKEVTEELMRLFYVAVTRAEHRCYIGAANYKGSENSPLAQFLNYSSGDNWLEKIQLITSKQQNQSQVIEIDDIRPNELQKKSNNLIQEQLQANTISSLENDNWDMLSFSKISKTKVATLALEKENDESEDDKDQLQDPAILEFRFSANKGADIGNILHNILEHTDFSRAEIDKVLLIEQLDRYKVIAREDIDKLKKWLEECLIAPISIINTSVQQTLIPELEAELDSQRESFCLADISNSQVLKEAEFYFPVANKKLYKKSIINILAEYRNQTIDFDEFNNHKLFGMLHGFIDLIFEYKGKYYVADYKSNYLGDKLEDYNQQSMTEKNQASFYDLQYLLYSVALNKYLKQNILEYNFEEHFGGVYYFYLRGMKNGYGVYQARPSFKIINKIDNLLARGKEGV